METTNRGTIVCYQILAFASYFTKKHGEAQSFTEIINALCNSEVLCVSLGHNSLAFINTRYQSLLPVISLSYDFKNSRYRFIFSSPITFGVLT